MTLASSDLLVPVAEYYSTTIRRHGPNPRGVDWKSGESQQLRFAQLLKVCQSLEGISLNDYGCGYGALLAYLNAQGRHVSYAGYDISSEMLAEARAVHPEASFVADDALLPVADYTVASGIFNVRLQASDEEWREHVLATLHRMAARSRRGFAFNMLTSYADADRKPAYLYFGDPLFFFDYCKRTFSGGAALLHDYPLFDFTIRVRL